jgi:ribosomal protein S18 acetylase RimI-like enzyme
VTFIRRSAAADADGCVAIVKASAEYFSSATHSEIAQGVVSGRCWVAHEADGAIVGFVLVDRRFGRAAEILHAAVSPNRRSRGIGTTLVTDVLSDLRAGDVDLVLVKTLDQSADYPPFERTRAFWKRLGFIQIAVIDPFPGWQAGNPAALLVRSLVDAPAAEPTESAVRSGPGTNPAVE